MKAFCESGHCKMGIHCGTCRDLEKGRPWREDIARHFGTDGVDWPCPRGHAWGYAPEPREWPNQTVGHALANARKEACRACNISACFLNRLLASSPCGFIARARRPGMVCPKGLWPPIEREG